MLFSPICPALNIGLLIDSTFCAGIARSTRGFNGQNAIVLVLRVATASKK